MRTTVPRATFFSSPTGPALILSFLKRKMSRFAATSITILALAALVVLANAQTLYISNRGTHNFLEENCSECPENNPCYIRNTWNYVLPGPCSIVFMSSVNASTFKYAGTGTIDVSGYPGTTFTVPGTMTSNIYFNLNFPNAAVYIHDMTIVLGKYGFPVNATSIVAERLSVSNVIPTDDTYRVTLTAVTNVTIRDSSAAAGSAASGLFQLSAFVVGSTTNAPSWQLGGTPFEVYLYNISCSTLGQPMAFAYAGLVDIQPGTGKRGAQAIAPAPLINVHVYNSVTKNCIPIAGGIHNAYFENIDAGTAYGVISRPYNEPYDVATNFTFVNFNRTLNPAGALRLTYNSFTLPSNASITLKDSHIDDLQFTIAQSNAQWTLINSPITFEYTAFYYRLIQNAYLPYPFDMAVPNANHNSWINGAYTSLNTSGAVLYIGAGSYDLSGSTFANNLTNTASATTATPEELAAVQLAGGAYFFGNPDTTSATVETTVPSFLVVGATDSTFAHTGPLVITGDILGGVTSTTPSSGSTNGKLSFNGPSVVLESINVGNYTIAPSASTSVVYRVTNPAHGIVFSNVNSFTTTEVAVDWKASVAGSSPTLGTPYLLAKSVSGVITATDASGAYIVTSSYVASSQSSFFTFSSPNPDAPPTAPVAPVASVPSSPSASPSTSTNPSTPTNPSVATSPSDNATPTAPGTATPSNTPDHYQEPGDAASLTTAAIALPALAIAVIAALM